jgi:hypothetical protein
MSRNVGSVSQEYEDAYWAGVAEYWKSQIPINRYASDIKMMHGWVVELSCRHNLPKWIEQKILDFIDPDCDYYVNNMHW